MYAQKTSDNLLRYIRRSEGAPFEHIEARERQILSFKDEIQRCKARILELWFQRKAVLDHCHKTICLLISAAQV